MPGPAVPRAVDTVAPPPQSNPSTPLSPDGDAEVRPVTAWAARLDFLGGPPGSGGRLGPYEVIGLIGRGGMGVVLKARDPVLRRLVAIKVLAPELATDSTARRRFLREGRSVAAIDHDHVVTIYAARRVGRLSYLVMPYIRGPSLAAKIRAGPLGLGDILRIGQQTAAGLAAAHVRRIIHRDLKPGNILLEGDAERVKITDFGLARSAHDNPLTQPGAILGTPRFMAPEQARGQAVDHRADLFSLGSVLYAMGTGQAPFLAPTMMAVLWQVSFEEPRPIREINPAIPGWLAAVIERLHAKDPAGRFQSAADVAEILANPPGAGAAPAAIR